MSILDIFRDKPWTAEQALADNLHNGQAIAAPIKKVGLRVFLGVVGSFFLLLVVAYIMRMEYTDWRTIPIPLFLWINTAVLILSSLAFQWARVSAARERTDDLKIAMAAAGILTIVFLVGQFVAWRELGAAGYYASTNPANGFFYLLTAVHGAHMIGGLVAWAGAAGRLWRGGDAQRTRMSVDLCAAYWHFLLAVWLVVFALLATGKGIQVILTICGLR